jgi:hypothetical protein
VSLDTEILAKLQMAIIQGRSLESLGMELTDELVTSYESIQREYQIAPQGVMAAIVDDVSWGSFDKLIEATEKAHGPMTGEKTIKELEAELATQAETAKTANTSDSD